MGIRFQCEACQRNLHVKDYFAGKRAVCPHCSASITIPLQSTREGSKKTASSTGGEQASGTSPTKPQPTAGADPAATAGNPGTKETMQTLVDPLAVSARAEKAKQAKEASHRAPGAPVDPETPGVSSTSNSRASQSAGASQEDPSAGTNRSPGNGPLPQSVDGTGSPFQTVADHGAASSRQTVVDTSGAGAAVHQNVGNQNVGNEALGATSVGEKSTPEAGGHPSVPQTPRTVQNPGALQTPGTMQTQVGGMLPAAHEQSREVQAEFQGIATSAESLLPGAESVANDEVADESEEYQYFGKTQVADYSDAGPTGTLVGNEHAAPSEQGSADLPAGDPIDESPTSVWYVRPASGGQFGPAAGPLMKRWIDEGRVAPTSYVWREGWEDWRLASEIFPYLLKPSSSAVPATGEPIQTPPMPPDPSPQGDRLAGQASSFGNVAPDPSAEHATNSAMGNARSMGDASSIGNPMGSEGAGNASSAARDKNAYGQRGIDDSTHKAIQYRRRRHRSQALAIASIVFLSIVSVGLMIFLFVMIAS